MPSLALIFHLIDIADATAVAGPVSLRAAELAAAYNRRTVSIYKCRRRQCIKSVP
jgi:hypothetical protein